MSDKNLIKNITSKDVNLAKQTIKNIINTKNLDDFKEICEKSDFIFPFLKTRIIKDFISFINEKNFDITFLFAKVYNCDFEEIVLSLWKKFANEDLTDRILELLENGSDDEKIYAINYFYFINDPVALEILYNEVSNENEAIKQATARTLSAFKDVKILNDMKEKISNSSDEFEKLEAYQFIINYQDKNSLNFVFENCFTSPFISSVVSSIKDNFSLEFLIKNFNEEIILKIFNVLIENYPENIELNTLCYYEIYDFIKYLTKNPTQYKNNLLLIAKTKFNEFNKNDVYSFDLDKNNKEELKEITNLLNSIKLDFSHLKDEFQNYSNKANFEAALEAVKILKDENYAIFLASLINDDKISPTLKAEIALVLKELNKTNLVLKENINKIEDDNIKALILSYL